MPGGTSAQRRHARRAGRAPAGKRVGAIDGLRDSQRAHRGREGGGPMSKAFVKEADGDGELPEEPVALPSGVKNYITPHGFRRLQQELHALLRVERPAVVETLAWAAGNGDRSENGDYIYGKKRLREIDRRIRYLMKRLEGAVVVDPHRQENADQVFFGATVTVRMQGEAADTTFQIVGVDEANASAGRISWIAPLARALIKAREGDAVRFDSPAGVRDVEIVAVEYR